jgi:WD40 repeat protein
MCPSICLKWLSIIAPLFLACEVSLGQQLVEKNVFQGHEDAVSMGAFTPDGEFFVTTSFDQTVRLWEIASHRERRAYRQHTGPVFCLAVSGNGSTLVTGAQDNTVRIWDLPLGKPLRRLPKSAVRVNAVEISPDGNWAISGIDNGHVQIDSLQDSENNLSRRANGTRQEHSASVLSLCYQQEGAYFVSGDASGRILLWSPELESQQGELIGQTSAVNQLAFSLNNQQVFSAGADGKVRIWLLNLSADTPVEINKELPIHEGQIRDLAIYSGGSQVITVGDDQRIVMTNVSNGTETRSYQISDNPSTDSSDNSAPLITDSEFTPTVVASRNDNQRVAVGTAEGKLLIWNANDGESPIMTFDLPASVTAICYSDDNQKLGVATSEPAVHLFGPSIPGTQPRRELVQHQQFAIEVTATDLVFDPDNQAIWSATVNGEVNKWQSAEIAQRRQMNHSGPVYGVAISRDGELVVSCSADQSLRVWDASSGRLRSQLRGHNGAVHAVAMSPDETFAVSSGADGTLRLWDIIGGRQLKQLTKFDATMYSIAIHPEGQLVAAAGADRKVHLLDMISGEELHTLSGHDDYIHCVAFDPSGERLLSYGYAGHLKIWRSSDGKLLNESRVGKVGNGARFSPDGTKILLTNGDGTARIVPAP